MLVNLRTTELLREIIGKIDSLLFVQEVLRMALKINSMRCPECGADLEYEEGREKMFCSYCGAQIVITNENEKIYRHIDEAAIKREETDRIIKLKKQEESEKINDQIYKMRMIKIKASIVIGVISGVSFILSMIFDSLGNLFFISLWGLIVLAWMWLGDIGNKLSNR